MGRFSEELEERFEGAGDGGSGICSGKHGGGTDMLSPDRTAREHVVNGTGTDGARRRDSLTEIVLQKAAG